MTESTTLHRICRVYPRMDMGGAENAIVQLLQEIDQTHMVVTHMEGMRAPEAQASAERYTFLKGARFAPLMEACRAAPITHLHTINDHLLGPLAAQLAGANRIIQTIHNDFQPLACHLVDHSITVGAELLELIATPARATWIPNGIEIPAELPPFQFWCETGVERPLRIVEMRRPDKLMELTLQEIVETGALDGIDFEAIGIGFDTACDDPRVHNMGPIPDPSPLLASADVLVMATTTETFGRTVYEAMAAGTLAMVTPIPAFTRVFTPEQVAYFDTSPPQPLAFRKWLEELATNPARCRQMRSENHRFVQARFSVATMAQRTEALYQKLLSDEPAPRSFQPADLEGTTPEFFGAIMDQVLSSEPLTCQAQFDQLPPTARAIVLWALVRTQRALPENRPRLLARAFTLAGPRPILCMDLGHALRDLGDLERAEKLYKQTTQLDPQNAEAHLARIDCLLQQGNRLGARTAFASAIKANPGVPYLQRMEATLATH